MAHAEFAAKLAPAAAQAAEMIASGRMHIPVAATYALSSIKEAVAHAQRGGKILLDVAGSSTGLGMPSESPPARASSTGMHASLLDLQPRGKS